jgi:hypothetical protein
VPTYSITSSALRRRAVPHFAPSGAPPLGQNTATNVSLASQAQLEPNSHRYASLFEEQVL